MASAVERRRFWSCHVARFARSGLSRRAYCERHGLAPATLDFWRRRLSAEPAPAFVPVQPREVVHSWGDDAAPALGLELHVGAARLVLPREVDTSWLASLLRALV